MRKLTSASLLSWCLCLLFLGACAVLIRFTFWGPFRLILPVQSPANAECVAALSLLALALLRSCRGQESLVSGATNHTRRSWIFCAALVVLLCVAYSSVLRNPFLFDDYGHIGLVSRSTLGNILSKFYLPQPDIFFRPLGFLVYYLNFKWAGFHPGLWHGWSLLIHILNCLLVFALARQFHFANLPSGFAALLFGIHGTRVEPVAWTDAQFDLLSTLFALLALLSFEKYFAIGKRLFLSAGLLLLLLAIVSKESAFCIPFVVLIVAILHKNSERKRILITAVATFVLCCVGFVYRMWMIGGMGGYGSGGRSDVLHLDPLRMAKALLWRLWGYSFFPVNWWGGGHTWVSVSLLGFLAALLFIALGTRLDRKRLIASLGVVLVASLPVQHLLILNDGLTGARFYYLPYLGIALFWATVADAAAGRCASLVAIFACVLFFNAAVLEHNLRIWGYVSRIAQSRCQAFARQIAALPGQVSVTGLPYQEHGVYFLANGFPDCVEMNSGVSHDKILVESKEDFDRSTTPNKFVWNERDFRRFEAASR